MNNKNKNKKKIRKPSLMNGILQTSRYLSMEADKVDLGTAPMTPSLFCPFLKNRTVGMLLIPYFEATFGLASVLSFKHTIFPA